MQPAALARVPGGRQVKANYLSVVCIRDRLVVVNSSANGYSIRYWLQVYAANKPPISLCLTIENVVCTFFTP
jgi:hypothetical protein